MLETVLVTMRKVHPTMPKAPFRVMTILLHNPKY